MPTRKSIIWWLVIWCVVRAALGINVPALANSRANKETITVLKGDLLPDQQGWLVSHNEVTTVDMVTHEGKLKFNTIGVTTNADRTAGHAVMWLYKNLPFDFNSTFSIQFTLQIHQVEQAHNFLDSGIMFYGSTVDPSESFSGGPRDQMIYFDENAIGWGDETEIFAMDTTDTFHTYTLSVDKNGKAEVYVDGTRRLTRERWQRIPRIGFGDMTNDAGINGKFSIGDILVTAPPQTGPPPPTPRRRLIPPSRNAPR